VLPEEVAKLIGKAGETVVMEVEKGAIKRIADAIGDSNPLYWDEEYARNSRCGGIIAPPGFTGWPAKWRWNLYLFYMPQYSDLYREWVDAMDKAGYTGRLDGGWEFDFFQLVRAGDTLACTPKITDIVERQGKSGTLTLTTFEMTYINQNGDVVSKTRNNMIYRSRS